MFRFYHDIDYIFEFACFCYSCFPVVALRRGCVYSIWSMVDAIATVADTIAVVFIVSSSIAMV